MNKAIRFMDAGEGVKQKEEQVGSGLFRKESMCEEVQGFFIHKKSKCESSTVQIP